MAERKNISSVVREFASPVAEELGLLLWDVEYLKEGADFVLRFTVDSPNGVTIEDCEKFHRAIDPVLDEHDPIENAYLLEVSSPGVERVLRLPEHFTSMIGSQVEVRLFTPVENSKLHRGILKAYDNGDITVECESGDITFKKALLSKVQTVFEW